MTRRKVGEFGRAPGKSVIAKEGFISARSIKGEYKCTGGRADRLTLYGGKDGRYEYRGRFAGRDFLSGTYYMWHNEGVELEVRFEMPDGVTPQTQTGILNLKNKTFAPFLATEAAPPESRAVEPKQVAVDASPSSSAWIRYVHESGDPYWYNASTNESSWYPPPGES